MNAVLDRPAVGIGAEVEARLASQPVPNIPVIFLQEDGEHDDELVPNADDLADRRES